MKNTIVIMTIAALVGFFSAPSAYAALESDNSYLLDDSETISILLNVDSNGVATFEDVFVTPQGGDDEFVMNSDTIVAERITKDHAIGQLFGKTLEGDSILVKYLIRGDSVHLFAKVWTDDGSIRVVSNGETFPLF